MIPEQLLDELTEHELLDQENGQVAISESFSDQLNSLKEEFERADASEVREQVRAFEELNSELILQAAENNPRFAAKLHALRQIDSLEMDEFAAAMVFLERFEREPLRDSGSPPGFLPIYGDQIYEVCALYQNAIVYVWLEDCEPCDNLSTTLGELGRCSNSPVGLFSVFGPKSAKHLHEEYDVVGGPAILFIEGGEIQSRLYGGHDDAIIKKEWPGWD